MITRNTDYSIQRLRGLSTDTKPTDVPNGSEFREMDTGKDFMYDEASGDWKEQPKKGGGGGGGGAPVLRDITINNKRTVGAASAKRVIVNGLYNSDNGKVYHASVAGNGTISSKVVVSGPKGEGTGNQNSTILVLSVLANASPIVVQSDSTNIFRQANFSAEGDTLQYHVIMFDDSTDQITLNIE